MASGSCRSLTELPEGASDVVEEARRAVLTTIDSRGSPHAVPVCFAIVNGEICSALDQKPKSGGTLARISNLRRNPAATVLFDRWDEDWTELAWVMVRGTGRIEPPGSVGPELISRYPQYDNSPPQGEVIVVRPDRVAYWTYR